MESYYVSLNGIGESSVEKEEIDIRDLKDDEAVIKAEYSMISAGTELSRAYGLKQGFEYPVRPGYCMVGRIIAKGENIKANIGDKVFAGAPHCSLVRFRQGDRVQGPLIFKIPDEIDSRNATILNLMLVALQGVNLTEVKKGDTVGVFGLGNIGIITALIYKSMGCKVIGLDPVKERCALANEMGIEFTISDLNQKPEIDRITSGQGFDIAIDVTGIAPVIISCIENTRPYGQVALLGSPRQSFNCDIMPIFSNIHMKNLKVLGAFNKTAPVYASDGSNNSVERNMEIATRMIMRGEIDVNKMITRVIDPQYCQQAYYDLMYKKDRTNAIVFDWRSY